MRAIKLSGLYIPKAQLCERDLWSIERFYSLQLYNYMSGEKERIAKYYYGVKGGYFIPRNAHLFDSCPIYISDVVDKTQEGADIDIEPKEQVYDGRIKKTVSFKWDKHQKEIVDTATKKPELLIKAPCGVGKTVISCRLIAKVKKRALILVIKDDLRQQFKNELVNFTTLKEDDISLDPEDTKTKVVITTIQMLNSRIKKDFKKMFLLYKNVMNFGITIIDEAHVATGPEKFTLAMLLFNSKRLVALSATPYRGKRREQQIFDQWFGHNVYEISSYQLKPIVKRIPYKSGFCYNGRQAKSVGYFKWGGKFNRMRYFKKLSKDGYYIKLLCEIIIKKYNEKRKIVALSETKDVINAVIHMLTTSYNVPTKDIGHYYNQEVKTPWKPKKWKELKSININTAGIDELIKVKGVSEKTATNVIKYREENGRFKYVEDIVHVTGFGSKLLDKIKHFLRIKGPKIKEKTFKEENKTGKKYTKSIIKPTKEETRKPIMLATYKKCSTGTNIPDLDTCVLMTPCGSYITIEQSVGRILRDVEGKNQPYVYDIIDVDLNETRSMWNQRKEKFYNIHKFELD